MTALNKNSPKVRTRTLISSLLAVLIAAGFIYLFYEISKQSAIFGDVKKDFEWYTSELNKTKKAFERKRREVADLDTDISSSRYEKADTDANLLKVKNDLRLASESLKIKEDEFNLVEKNWNNLRIENDAADKKLIIKNENLTQIKNSISDADIRLAKLIDEISDNEIKKTDTEKAFQQKSTELSLIKKDLATTTTDKTFLAASILELQARKDEFDNDLEIIEKNVSKKEADLVRIKSDVNTAQLALDNADVNLKNATKKLSDVNDELLIAQAQLAKKQANADKTYDH